MSSFKLDWLKAPADRDVIRRWTSRSAGDFEVALPQPAEPESFQFLVVGDTGDSELTGAQFSPQDAVAEHLAADAALPGSRGRAQLLLHTGDVVYMTGERRLYERNFRRPYTPFLTAESTVDRMVFRIPFLPVPGNHDYYDLVRWARLMVRAPLLGAGVRLLAREFFAYNVPGGGSDMGRAYMEAFVDGQAAAANPVCSYLPGECTRLPNRYYWFRCGSADFFAVDSNTLEAPPPTVDAGVVRADAAKRVAELEAEARAVSVELSGLERELERWQAGVRSRAAEDRFRRASGAAVAREMAAALETLRSRLEAVDPPLEGAAATARSAAAAREDWEREAGVLASNTGPSRALRAIEALNDATTEVCTVIRAVDGCLNVLEEGETRTNLTALRDRLEAGLRGWREISAGEPPPDLCERLRSASDAALDLQRELARERRRTRYRADDHDVEQLAWLDRVLARSETERPDAWRILYLHHPPFSAISNHCERPDNVGVRENLLAVLKNRVHAVIAGHAHAFEWLRCASLPNTAFFVTGGGGQISLRRSVLDPRRFQRYRRRYEGLRNAGVVECATAGRGPAAADGEQGMLYHYLRVEVTPEVLRVRPVGVRRTRAGYRREEPMPVNYAPELPEDQPPWLVRRLDCIELRRDAPPSPRWA